MPNLPSGIYPEARHHSNQVECRYSRFIRSLLLLGRMGAGSSPWMKTYLPTTERVITRPRYRRLGLNSSPRERNSNCPWLERCSLCPLSFGDFYNDNDLRLRTISLRLLPTDSTQRSLHYPLVLLAPRSSPCPSTIYYSHLAPARSTAKSSRWAAITPSPWQLLRIHHSLRRHIMTLTTTMSALTPTMATLHRNDPIPIKPKDIPQLSLQLSPAQSQAKKAVGPSA